MKKQNNLRSLAAQAVEQVVEQGQSLSNAPAAATKVAGKEQSATSGSCALASCEGNSFTKMAPINKLIILVQ